MAQFNLGSQHKKIKFVGSITKSKITNSSGCGALVEFPGFSGIMGGQNLWDLKGTKKFRIHEKALEDYLKKDYFLQVSSEIQNAKGYEEAYKIPVLRFPEYYYCPSCHELDYARRLAKNFGANKDITEPLLCSRCKNVELIPSRFVMACEAGHIEEFPFFWWVHRGEKCENPRLMLEYKGYSGGLESIIISCATCKKSNSMKNVLNKEATRSLRCNGKSPWLGKSATCDCGREVRVLLRGATNIYFPDTVSALTIPPWSTAVQKSISENIDFFKMSFVNGVSESARKAISDNFFDDNGLGEILSCTKDEFFRQLGLRLTPNNQQIIDPSDFRKDEYRAFVGADVNDDMFKTESAQIDERLLPYISKVKLVKRIRKVNVLTSFRRIDAFSQFSAPLSDIAEKWLPATEMLGEGIFIEFSKISIENWEVRVGSRYEQMKSRYNDNRMGRGICSFSNKLVLVHSISHLIMRELAYSCGYDAAALSERIYVSDEDSDIWMAGVLIYTTTSCSDGSLGGLVRLGQKDRFMKVISSMLKKAIWCSNDPICIETQEQLDNTANYAACHACSFVPEIACEFGNKVLDRVAVVGKPGHEELGFFSEFNRNT